jgi:hypothetical protein
MKSKYKTSIKSCIIEVTGGGPINCQEGFNSADAYFTITKDNLTLNGTYRTDFISTPQEGIKKIGIQFYKNEDKKVLKKLGIVELEQACNQVKRLSITEFGF